VGWGVVCLVTVLVFVGLGLFSRLFGCLVVVGGGFYFLGGRVGVGLDW